MKLLFFKFKIFVDIIYFASLLFIIWLISEDLFADERLLISLEFAVVLFGIFTFKLVFRLWLNPGLKKILCILELPSFFNLI